MSLEKEIQWMKTKHPNSPLRSWYENLYLPCSWQLVTGRLKGKKVLDIGCASGWVTYYALREGADALATDIFDTMIRPDLPFKYANKEALPFKDNLFDFVLTANVLHHGDLQKTSSEACRVLKKGGELISFQEPCIPNNADEERCLQTFCKKEIEGGIDEHRPSLEKYKKALSIFKGFAFYDMHDKMFERPTIGNLVVIEKESWEGGLAIQAVR